MAKEKPVEPLSRTKVIESLKNNIDNAKKIQNAIESELAVFDGKDVTELLAAVTGAYFNVTLRSLRIVGPEYLVDDFLGCYLPMVGMIYKYATLDEKKWDSNQ